MNHATRRRLVGVALGAAVLGGGASAEPAGLDDAALIDTLSKRGMHQLLDRYTLLHPPDDPAAAAVLEVARLRVRSQLLMDQAVAAAATDSAASAASRAQSDEAFGRMLEAQRALAFNPDWRDRRARGVWLTDLAEMLLFDLLTTRQNSAAAFDEFGVATARQRDALEAHMPEALQAAALAEQAIFGTQGVYARDADARAGDQASGLYDRLLEDYGRQRTPLYLAMAMYGTALLPDDTPYFLQLGRPDGVKLPGQRNSVEAERRRLLQGAAERLEGFLADDPGGGEGAARALLGRVLTRLGPPDEAIEQHLDPVIGTGLVEQSSLSALLGKALALVEMERYPLAEEALDVAERHALVQDSPLMRLLVTDVRFRVSQAEAASAGQSSERERLVAGAYDVYFTMLKDPTLGDAAAGLRSLIYQRWAGDLEVGAAVDGLPPAVRMAVGEVARMKGQQLLLADVDGESGRQWLRWAVAVNGALDDAALPDAVRASGLFNGAFSSVLLDQGNVATLAEAVGAWTRVAEQFPREPSAEQAITYAADYAAALMQQAPDHPLVRPRYEQTMAVLFEQYDTLDAAVKHRLFYAYTVYQQSGQHVRAAEVYARVPFGHPQYFEAQALRLFNLERAFSLAEGAERDRLRREARSVAEQVISEARPARRNGPDADAQRNAARGQAAAMLTLAELDRQQGDTDAALRRLGDLEDAFGETPGLDDLMRNTLEKRILTLVGVNRFADAAAEAERMMDRFPASAAGVITGVLTGLETQITAKRRAIDEQPARAETLEREAASLAGAASTVARLLVDWAETQGFEEAEMLAYQLPYVRALRVAGRTEEAAQYLQREGVLDYFADDLGVLIAAGETYFDLGIEPQPSLVVSFRVKDPEAALRAATYFDRIITGLQPPYPDAYWNAWVKRLSINLALGEGAADIPLRIRQLADAYPDLGGPAYRARFEALRAAAMRER